MTALEARRRIMLAQGVQNICIPNYAFVYLSKDSGLDIVSATNNETRVALYGKGSQAGTYTTSGITLPVILLPRGTESITVRVTKNTNYIYDSDSTTNIFWTKDEPYQIGSTYVRWIQTDRCNSITETEKTITVPEGADSFLLTIRFRSSYIQETPQATAESIGLSITFNK